MILQHYDGPVAATYWWVKTGSADETSPEAGFAHFLEHMLFKDAAAKETGKASSGQLARAVESMGGDINAYTSFDQTVYHVTCAAQHWEKVIDVFGGMAKPQKFLKSDFEREREVILEELRKNEDSPGRQLFQKLFTATFKKHPYGKPVIGFTKTLKAAKVGTLEAFYRRNYVSGRMGLILVGPLEDATGARKADCLKMLEKRFGKQVHAKRAAPVFARAGEPELRKDAEFAGQAVRRQDTDLEHRLPRASFGSRGHPGARSSFRDPGHGRTLAALSEAFLREVSLVNEVSGGLYVPRDPGMLYFQAEMDSEEQSRVRRARDVQGAAPAPATKARRRRSSPAWWSTPESERLYATQTADGMASRLGFLKYIRGD